MNKTSSEVHQDNNANICSDCQSVNFLELYKNLNELPLPSNTILGTNNENDHLPPNNDLQENINEYLYLFEKIVFMLPRFDPMVDKS